jgi:hypothetical protein
MVDDSMHSIATLAKAYLVTTSQFTGSDNQILGQVIGCVPCNLQGLEDEAAAFFF